MNKVKAKVERAVAKATTKSTKIFVAKRKLEGPLVVRQRCNTRLGYFSRGNSYAAWTGSRGRVLGLYRLHFDKCCSRNRNTYPSLLHQKLGTSNFTFCACFGARAIQGPNNVLKKMRETLCNAQPVAVTVGRNDTVFTKVTKKCIPSAAAKKRCSTAIRFIQRGTYQELRSIESMTNLC